MAGKKIIIIGNGIAGNSAADTIRRLDDSAEIIIICEEKYPLYSPCVLPHYISREIDDSVLFLKDNQHYQDARINIISGKRVTAIKPAEKKIFLGPEAINYDKLIIATGSSPLIPPIKGHNIPGVFTLKTMQDVEGIEKYPAKSAVVIGTGLVGVEGAAALRKKGYEVFLIELLDRIMPRNFNSPASKRIERILTEQGIKVLTGEKVVEIMGTDRVSGVRTDKSDIDCELVIMAAGMKPNTSLAVDAGIATGELRGIKTDKHLETSIPEIYACGDCIESLDVVNTVDTLNLLWGFAQKQGEVVGSNCLGIKKEYHADLPSVGTKLFDTAVASIGCIADEINPGCRMLVKEYPGRFSLVALKDETIIGAQMIGQVDSIGIFSSIIKEGMKLEEVRKHIHGKSLRHINPVYFRLEKFL